MTDPTPQCEDGKWRGFGVATPKIPRTKLTPLESDRFPLFTAAASTTTTTKPYLSTSPCGHGETMAHLFISYRVQHKSDAAKCYNEQSSEKVEGGTFYTGVGPGAPGARRLWLFIETISDLYLSTLP